MTTNLQQITNKTNNNKVTKIQHKITSKKQQKYIKLLGKKKKKKTQLSSTFRP